jgi:asparagine synthase (glutamine-hydrolysing)
MGFSVPLARWFRGPLRQRMRQALLEGPMLESGLINAEVVRQVVEEHESGRSDHSTAMWSLLMFDSFLRNTLGAEPGRVAA